jgi:hypothetical protein
MVEPLLSPNGRYKVYSVAIELKMSHWVERPVVVDLESGTTVLNLDGSLWSADTATWSKDSRMLHLEMRRYPGDTPGITLELNMKTQICTVHTSNAHAEVPVSQLEKWLESNYRKTKQKKRQVICRFLFVLFL